MTSKPATFEQLVEIMRRLRAPDGCPWDRKQTLMTIKDYFLEEVYEAVEAIEDEDQMAIQEELGDVLFEVTFLAQIAEEKGWFNVYDSLGAVCEKLVHRHPHVFGDEQYKDSDEVWREWNRRKGEEKKEKLKGGPEEVPSLLQGVPRKLPALLQALRVSERAASRGFEWPSQTDLIESVYEEATELAEAFQENDREHIIEELGDLFFVLVNLARFNKISPQDALLASIRKFRKRFRHMEVGIHAQGKRFEDFDLDGLHEFWREAKVANKPKSDH